MANLKITYMDSYIHADDMDIDLLVHDVGEDTIPNAFNDMDDYRSFMSTIFELDDMRIETDLMKYQMLEHLISNMFDTVDALPLDVDLKTDVEQDISLVYSTSTNEVCVKEKEPIIKPLELDETNKTARDLIQRIESSKVDGTCQNGCASCRRACHDYKFEDPGARIPDGITLAESK